MGNAHTSAQLLSSLRLHEFGVLKTLVTKPFAGYRDFDVCVAANQEKEDPEGYCASIMRQVEKEANHSSVMIALYPSPAIAQDLALDPSSLIDAPEPPEDLHVTLMYFGDVADLSPSAIEAMHVFASAVTSITKPLTVRIGGLAYFTAPTDEPSPFVLLMDSPELHELRELLEEVIPVEPHNDHAFNPHLTLAYVPQPISEEFAISAVALPIDAEEIIFDALTLVVAGTRYDFPFTMSA